MDRVLERIFGLHVPHHERVRVVVQSDDNAVRIGVTTTLSQDRILESGPGFLIKMYGIETDEGQPASPELWTTTLGPYADFLCLFLERRIPPANIADAISTVDRCAGLCFYSAIHTCMERQKSAFANDQAILAQAKNVSPQDLEPTLRTMLARFKECRMDYEARIDAETGIVKIDTILELLENHYTLDFPISLWGSSDMLPLLGDLPVYMFQALPESDGWYRCIASNKCVVHTLSWNNIFDTLKGPNFLGLTDGHFHFLPNGTVDEEIALGNELFKRFAKKVADTFREVYNELKSAGTVEDNSTLEDLVYAASV